MTRMSTKVFLWRFFESYEFIFISFLTMFPEITLLNHSHQTMRQLADQLNACKENEVAVIYGRLICAAEQAFGNEQEVMEKYQFPAERCHLEQHARVLRALHQVHTSVMEGNFDLGRHVGACLLPGWFDLHNATLDAALVLWVSHKTSPDNEDSDTQAQGFTSSHRPAFPGQNWQPPRLAPETRP